MEDPDEKPKFRGICAALKLLEFKGNLAVSKKHYPKEEWIDIVKSGTYLD